MLSNHEIAEAGALLLTGESLRAVEETFHTSYRALKRLQDYIIENEITFDDWGSMGDEERRKAIYKASDPNGKKEVFEVPEFEMIYQKMKSKTSHYTIKCGWIEYRKSNPDGMQLSQFYKRYRVWEKEKHPGKNATCPVNRMPGRYLYIDWVGDQPALVRDPNDPDRRVKAHFLVFTMGYSSLAYAVAFPDEKTPSVIEGMNQAITYMGALPQRFRPDNMKTAVSKNNKDELILSTAMKDFESYYDTLVDPARPLKPRDKASVERLVLILETELFPALEETLFESFHELNNVVRVYIDNLNTRIKSGESMSRRELFEKFDKPEMKPLPPKLFTLVEYRKVKVQRNCHVKFNNIYCSVPYQYVGQSVLVKIAGTDVEICSLQNQSICHHSLLNLKGNYVTVEEHLKSSHQKARAIEARGIHYFYHQAEKVGPNMKRYIEKMVAQYEYEEQSFNACSGVVHQVDKYSAELAEKVAAYCLSKGKIGYKAFIRELTFQAREDQSQQPDRTSKKAVPTMAHSNIRGKDYYK